MTVSLQLLGNLPWLNISAMKLFVSNILFAKKLRYILMVNVCTSHVSKWRDDSEFSSSKRKFITRLVKCTLNFMKKNPIYCTNREVKAESEARKHWLIFNNFEQTVVSKFKFKYKLNFQCLRPSKERVKNKKFNCISFSRKAYLELLLYHITRELLNDGPW